MTTYVFVNNYNSSLNAAITASATTLTVASAAGLPTLAAGDVWTLTLSTGGASPTLEIVYVTAISGSTLTIQRGKEGTTAAAWPSGSLVYAGITAAELEAFYQGTVTTGVVSWKGRTGAVVPASGDYTWSQIGGTFPYVTSFNTRVGAVVLNATDVNTALGYTAANDALVVHIAGSETITGAKTFATIVNGSQRIIATGWGSSPAGQYASIGVFSGSAYLQAYDGTNSVTYPLTVQGSTVDIIGPTTFANGTTTTSTGIFNGGINFGSVVASSPTTLTSHIALYAANYGFSITAGALNLVANGSVYAFEPASAIFPGSLTCTTLNATSSDRRLKHDITPVDPRPLHRRVPFTRYELNGTVGRSYGSIAQDVQAVAPEYVTTFKHPDGERLALDYGRVAHEEAQWAAREVDALHSLIAAQQRQLDKLEADIVMLRNSIRVGKPQ